MQHFINPTGSIQDVGKAQALDPPSTDARIIRSFVFLLGGFTQHAGEDTGMMRLWAELFRWRDRQTGTRTMLMPREWNDSTDAMVAMVERHAETGPGRRPRIILVGYSYGGGWTVPRLAGTLARAGRTVDLMILIDPVWRGRMPLFKLLSFTGAIPITIPANVRRVLTWRQQNGKAFDPKGSPLRLDDPMRTRIVGAFDWTSRGVTHRSIQYEPAILIESFTRIINLIEVPAA